MLPHCKSHHYFSVTSLNVPIFFFAYVKYLSVCMKSKPASGRAGEAKCSSSQRLITWFCFCVQRQPCQSDPNAETLLNCLHAVSPSTVARRRLWATSIRSFFYFLLWILPMKGGFQEQQRGVRTLKCCRTRREWCRMRLCCGAVGEATRFRLLLG